MKKYLIGIDIGTSAVKVALFDICGQLIKNASSGYEVGYPKPGFAEIDADDWYTGMCRALKEIFADGRTDSRDIYAVGVDGISWCAVPVDKRGAPLAKTPIWTDTRALTECAEVLKKIPEQTIFGLSGNRFTPNYSTPKILWFKKHMEDVYRDTHKFLQCNGYIVYKLTGNFTQDRSQGYGYHFFDTAKGEYDFAMAERLGIDAEKIPDLFFSDDIAGEITGQAAADTGLCKGTPVIAGGLDAACAAFGAGVIHGGQTQEQGGQAGGMSICTDTALSHNKLISSRHVVRGKWLLQGGTTAGGASLKWFMSAFGDYEKQKAIENNLNAFDLLTAPAAKICAGSDGMIFLPYLMGERSPLWDASAKGVFYNISFSSKKAHFVRAVMEGVAYSLRHNLDTAKEAGIIPFDIISVGGAAKSPLWTQIKADAIMCRIKTLRGDCATAQGAAMLAGIAAGVYKDYSEAVKTSIKFDREYVPDAAAGAIYDKSYGNYLKLYENLKNQMREE